MSRADGLVKQATAVLEPLEAWAHNCHAASVHLMRSGVFGTCRVARGWADGVVGSEESAPTAERQ